MPSKLTIQIITVASVVSSLAGCATGCEERVRNSSNALTHVVLVCKDANDQIRLQRGIDQWLSKNKETAPISQIIASNDESEASVSGVPKLIGMEDTRGFDRISSSFYGDRSANARLGYTFPILRRLRMRDRIVTTYREGAEKGSGPVFRESTQLRSGTSSPPHPGTMPEVLWFANPGGLDDLYVFANVTSIPSCSVCEDIGRRVLGLGLPENTQGVVSLRQTPWFELSGFPLVFKFGRHQNAEGDSRRAHGLIVPTVSEYYQSKEARCRFGRHVNKGKCSLSGSWELDEFPKVK